MKDRNRDKIRLHREQGNEQLSSSTSTSTSAETALLKNAEEFLVSHVKHRNYIEETIHPWRKDARQVILHSFRVGAYATRIIEAEKARLMDEEILIIKLASILHDVGKFYRKENHAEKSCEVVGKWLEGLDLPQTSFDRERFLAMIAGHSNKDAEDLDLCSMILKDADTLDEIGAISIFMTSNWLDKTSPYFFHELSARLKEFELAFCDKNDARLRTACAKEIMFEKRTFIEGFIRQLDVELDGTMEFYELLGDKL